MDINRIQYIKVIQKSSLADGNKFMESKYDAVINTNVEDFLEALEKAFADFCK